MRKFQSKTDFIALTLSRQLCQMAKQYDDAINFTLGDPDISTPKPICDASYEAVLAGNTHYAPNAGLPKLKTAICSYVNNKRGTDYTEDNLIVTVGAVEAIYLSFMALLSPGDEVIVLAPYWSQYVNITKLLGATPVVVDEFEQGFTPSIGAIKSAVNSKTKVIVINSPNNPAGTIYSKSFLKSVSEIAVENDLYIFADEVYDTLVYENEFNSLANICPKDNLLLFNSCSKAFAMTGWRVGYVLGNEDYIKSIVKLQQNIAASVPTITQYAALEAFSNADKYTKEIHDVFEKRRSVVIDALNSVPGIEFNAPQGTFYAFIDISSTGIDSKTFCFLLLEREHVALVPGIAYGKKFDSYVRLAFTHEENVLIEGIKRIERFINTINNM